MHTSTPDESVPGPLRCVAALGLIGLLAVSWLVAGHELVAVVGTSAVLTFAALGGRAAR